MIRTFILLFIIFSLFTGPVHAGQVNKLSIGELKESLNAPNTYVLDVRTGSDWSSSKFKIEGAIRSESKDFGNWSKQYAKDDRLVLYCS